MNADRTLLGFVYLALGTTAATLAAATTMTGWRGDATGTYPDANPPLTWSKDTNVVWKTKMPGRSNASPLVLGDRLFVCSEPETLVCVALKDGAILWTRPNTYLDIVTPAEAEKAKQDRVKADEILARLKPLQEESRRLGGELKKTPDNAELKTRAAELKSQIDALNGDLKSFAEYAAPSTHDVNGYSSPTPATDGKYVYVVFGNGVAASYDVNGTRRWARLIEKPVQGWGHSASPVFADGKLIVHIGRVTALDPATGAAAWQTESAQAWGSEVAARIGDTPIVITPSGDFIRASDGRKLASKVSGLTYCAPVVADGVVYFIQHGGKAVRLPVSAGDTIQPEVLWETRPKDDRYYASPVVHAGLIYAVTQAADFSVIDAADGKVVYTRKLDIGNTCYPSVTLAGNRVYVSSDTGRTVVLEPGREYKEVGRGTLETFRSCPVFVGSRVYLRGGEYLWCLGE